MFLFAGAFTLGATLGDDAALAMALRAGSSGGEAAKDTLLDSAHLPCAIAVRASARLTTRLAADTLAQGAVLDA
jgi:hypothetical protein